MNLSLSENSNSFREEKYKANANSDKKQQEAQWHCDFFANRFSKEKIWEASSAGATNLREPKP